jgi:hypothetical protein
VCFATHLAAAECELWLEGQQSGDEISMNSSTPAVGKFLRGSTSSRASSVTVIGAMFCCEPGNALK